MCGRFTITVSHEQLETYVKNNYNINQVDDYELPRYNVAPGTDVISIIHDGKKHRIGLLKWGFVPSFSKDQKINIINAKAESLFEKPSFKNAVINQRCVIIADGFYEWQQTTKQPMRIITDSKLFSIAGIWNTIITKENKKIHTVAIITTTPNNIMKPVHDRMPVILTKETEAIWLDRNIKDPNKLKEVLKPYPFEMHVYPVSKKVNKVTYQKPDAVDQIEVDF